MRLYEVSILSWNLPSDARSGSLVDIRSEYKISEREQSEERYCNDRYYRRLSDSVRALRACRDDKIQLIMTSPHMGMVIRPAEPKEDSDYTYLVLPLRLKD